MVVVVLLMSWGQLWWLLLLLLHLVLLVMVAVLVIVVVVLLLLQLLLVMAGRRGTHFERRTRPSGCHLLLSVPRIGHGRVMMRRLTRIGFLVERDPLLLGCLGGRFHGGRVQRIESGQDLLTRPFLAPLPLLNHGTGEAPTHYTTIGTGTCFIIMNGGRGQRGQQR